MVSEESFNHYKIGHKHTDAVHWHLIELMNSAILLLKNKQSEEALDIVKTLRTALVQHIAEEEQLMRSIQFLYYDSHAKEHIRILSELDKIPIMVVNKKLSEHVVSHFEMIIMSHIDHYDMQIAEYLHK